MTRKITNENKNNNSFGRGTKPKKILIADDDRGILKVISLMLRLEGYEVETTDFGMAILEMDDGELPDLILLDLWMAGIDGREVCCRLKSDHSRRHIPVVLISAGQELPKVASECAADDFLEKPFDQDQLLEKVSHFIN